MSLLKVIVPRSLLGRALLIVVAPLILMQVLSAYVFYDTHWDQVSKRLSLGLAGDIAVLVSALSSSGQREVLVPARSSGE